MQCIEERRGLLNNDSVNFDKYPEEYNYLLKSKNINNLDIKDIKENLGISQFENKNLLQVLKLDKNVNKYNNMI